jgi:hypothetical protein
MSPRGPNRFAGVLLWFGVLGAPLAWVVLHLVGFGASTAACNVFGQRHSINPNAWALGLTIACGAVALGALVAAIVMWAATRTEDTAPPLGRMHFLATLGLILGPLFVFMILMAGLGVTVLPRCVQS